MNIVDSPPEIVLANKCQPDIVYQLYASDWQYGTCQGNYALMQSLLDLSRSLAWSTLKHATLNGLMKENQLKNKNVF